MVFVLLLSVEPAFADDGVVDDDDDCDDDGVVWDDNDAFFISCNSSVGFPPDSVSSCNPSMGCRCLSYSVAMVSRRFHANLNFLWMKSSAREKQPRISGLSGACVSRMKCIDHSHPFIVQNDWERLLIQCGANTECHWSECHARPPLCIGGLRLIFCTNLTTPIIYRLWGLGSRWRLLQIENPRGQKGVVSLLGRLTIVQAWQYGRLVNSSR